MIHVYTCTQWYRCGDNMIPLHSLVMGQYLAGNGLVPSPTGAPRTCTWTPNIGQFWRNLKSEDFKSPVFKIYRSVESTQRALFCECLPLEISHLRLKIWRLYKTCFYILQAPPPPYSQLWACHYLPHLMYIVYCIPYLPSAVTLHYSAAVVSWAYIVYSFPATHSSSLLYCA